MAEEVGNKFAQRTKFELFGNRESKFCFNIGKSIQTNRAFRM